VPTSYADLMQHEDFADFPEPHLVDHTYEDYVPRTGTAGEWSGEARTQPPVPMPLPLPVLAPLSPMMGSFDMNRKSSTFASYTMPTPTPSYEDEQTRQKRLYGEVAHAAGVAEPITPGIHLNASTNSTISNTTTSSFSAHDPMPLNNTAPSRLPAMNLNLDTIPPRPFEHGRPLSPLVEVATPMSYASRQPKSSYESQYQNLYPASASPSNVSLNPFDDVPLDSHAAPTGPRSITDRSVNAGKRASRASRASQGSLASNASGTGSNPFPMPRFPPPSPGSVPGSITDSPSRWAPQGSGMGKPQGRGVSLRFDEDDAYGGI
jgi:hypothetical protein